MEKAVWKLSPQLWNADLESSAIFLTFAHQIILTHMSYPICFVSLVGRPRTDHFERLEKTPTGRYHLLPRHHKQKRTTTLPCGPYYRRTGNREVCSPVLHAPDEQRPGPKSGKSTIPCMKRPYPPGTKRKRWSLWRKAMQGSILPYSIYTTNSKRTASKWNEPPEYQLSLQRVL